jgi:type II secretory pathway pseudopilin PulG
VDPGVQCVGPMNTSVDSSGSPAFAPPTSTRRRALGFTLLEVVVSLGILAFVSTMILTFEVGFSDVHIEREMRAQLHHQVRAALVTLSTDLGRALTTTGGELLTCDPVTGTDARAIQFREVTGGSAAGPIWGPTIVFTSPGATGDLAAAGIVRLRADGLHTAGPLGAFVAQQRGPDGLWGTLDDDCRLTQGQVSVRTLLPGTMAPQTGPMLRIDVAASLVTITIRSNQRKGTGWLLPVDLVLTERVALKQ